MANPSPPLHESTPTPTPTPGPGPPLVDHSNERWFFTMPTATLIADTATAVSDHRSRTNEAASNQPSASIESSRHVNAAGNLTSMTKKNADSTTQNRKADDTTNDANGPATRKITTELLNAIGAQKFDKWFGHATLRVQGHDLEIATDSQFVANWIGTHFREELRGAVESALGSDAAFRVEVDRSLAPTSSDAPSGNPGRDWDGPSNPNAPRPVPARTADGPRPFRRVPVFRQLDDFIVGTSNELAYAAARRIAEDNDPNSISPLFIHGECGVGKTHLLQGICHRFARVHPRTAKSRYVTGEQFTNEYIAAVRNNALEQFRKRIRQLDLLVIDDIHFLASKMRTQSEFLHTLDAIDLTGARVVLASDAHPRQIKSFRQALTSRFMSGMVVQVHCPDRETRLRIIQRLSQARGLRLNEAAVDLIASNCIGSVRELEGAITKLSALNALGASTSTSTSTDAESRPNAGTGENVVGAVLTEQLFNDQGWQPSSPVRMNTVIDVVCDRLKVSRSDLIGTRRHRRVVLARALIAHLGRTLTTHSYPEIAQSLGRAYHSTVHTAAQRLRRQLDADEQFSVASAEPPIRLRELVDQLRHEILRVSARN